MGRISPYQYIITIFAILRPVKHTFTNYCLKAFNILALLSYIFSAYSWHILLANIPAIRVRQKSPSN